MSKTKKILLTQGKVAIVDAEDYDWLNQWKWCANKDRNTFYAIRTAQNKNGKRFHVSMHRLILATPTDMQTDHRNGDGLDNRRANLRICTNQENAQNQKLRKNNTSGHKGVSWHVRDKQWQAYIKIDGKTVCLGRYDDINEAVVARRVKEKEAFGNFAQPAMLGEMEKSR